MDIYAGDRGVGKTEKLIAWAAAEEAGTPRYIVVPTANDVELIWRRIRDAGMVNDVRMPVYFDEATRIRGAWPGTVFGLDDLDRMLPSILHSVGIRQPIDIATITASTLLAPR